MSMTPSDRITLTLVRVVWPLPLSPPFALCSCSCAAVEIQGRAVLSNKYARMAFVCYALLLHALIFLVRRPGGRPPRSFLAGTMFPLVHNRRGPLEPQVLYKYSHTAASTLSQAEQCHKLFAASGPVGNSHSDGHHVHFDSSELGT